MFIRVYTSLPWSFSLFCFPVSLNIFLTGLWMSSHREGYQLCFTNAGITTMLLLFYFLAKFTLTGLNLCAMHDSLGEHFNLYSINYSWHMWKSDSTWSKLYLLSCKVELWATAAVHQFLKRKGRESKQISK